MDWDEIGYGIFCMVWYTVGLFLFGLPVMAVVWAWMKIAGWVFGF